MVIDTEDEDDDDDDDDTDVSDGESTEPELEKEEGRHVPVGVVVVMVGTLLVSEGSVTTTTISGVATMVEPDEECALVVDILGSNFSRDTFL